MKEGGGGAGHVFSRQPKRWTHRHIRETDTGIQEKQKVKQAVWLLVSGHSCPLSSLLLLSLLVACLLLCFPFLPACLFPSPILPSPLFLCPLSSFLSSLLLSSHLFFLLLYFLLLLPCSLICSLLLSSCLVSSPLHSSPPSLCYSLIRMHECRQVNLPNAPLKSWKIHLS